MMSNDERVSPLVNKGEPHFANKDCISRVVIYIPLLLDLYINLLCLLIVSFFGELESCSVWVIRTTEFYPHMHIEV
jgi:hypothetical protein